MGRECTALVREDNSPYDGASSMFRKLGFVLKGRHALRAARERARRRRSIAARRTDIRRWLNAGSYNPSWADRLDSAMPLIGDALWVADIGCGLQALRQRLAPAVTYLPMDLQRWTDDTVLCDLNAKQLPDDYLSVCDVCVVMGVLEYVYEPDWLLQRLAEHVEALVLSYNPADRGAVDRPSNGWVNAFTADEILAVVERASFRIEAVSAYGDQILIKAVRRDFDDACRERRDVRRRAFQETRKPAIADPIGVPPSAVPVEPIAPAAGSPVAAIGAKCAEVAGATAGPVEPPALPAGAA